MAWGNVSWATQDVISLTKMTQINDNALDNRKRATFELIVNNPLFDYSSNFGSISSQSIRLEIDGTQFGETHQHNGQSSGSGSEADIDISSLPNGLHYIKFAHYTTIVLYSKGFAFLKTDTNDYLSMWYSFTTGDSKLKYKDVHILLHQNVENYSF